MWRRLLLVVGFALAGCGAGDDGVGSVDAGIDGSPSVISISGLTARVVATYRCDPQQSGTMIDCANYRLTLSLSNASGTQALARVDRFHIEVGTVIFDTGASAACDTPPFMIGPGQNSGVIDLELFWYNATYQVPALIYPCTPPDPEAALFTQALPAAPTTGTVMVQIDGVMSDAVPFVAAGSATLL